MTLLINLVSNDSLPEHPFVACVIDGVPVNALFDTGSMKSFISDRIHNIFDFDDGRLKNTSQSHRCTSITGGDLNIAETISTIVTFSRSKHNYHSSFLVSSNIPVVSPREASKTNVVLVQSRLKGVNKVIVPEGVTIPARSEMVIEGLKERFT